MWAGQVQSELLIFEIESYDIASWGLIMCSGWKIFYRQEKKENEAHAQRLVQAKIYHTRKVENLIFEKWRIS